MPIFPRPTEDRSQEFRLAQLPPEQRAELLEGLNPEELLYNWGFQGRPSQLGVTDSQARIILFNAGRGSGKELDVDTPIPTPTGWVRNGDIETGDYVLSEDGSPTRVLYAHPISHGHRSYEVVFDDGSVIVANGDHRWFTWDKAARKAHGRAVDPTIHPRVRTTDEIRATLRAQKGRETNHSIANTAPLQLPETDLPLDPWVLGFWLGDGYRSTLCLGDDDSKWVLAEMSRRGWDCTHSAVCINYHTKEPAAASNYSFAGLDAAVRRAGVGSDKRVPRSYLRGSESQRRDLLAGLLDSDGSVSASGSVDFSNARPWLADAVFELAVSLGYKPTLRTKMVRPTSAWNRDHKEYGPYHLVSFTPNEQLFRSRLAAAQSGESGLINPRSILDLGGSNPAQRTRTTHRYIVDVREVESRPMRCIAVDAPSHLYLAGRSMIPTHNSRTGAEWIKDKTSQKDRPVRIALIGRTAADVRDVMLQGESGLLSVYPPSEMPKYIPTARRVEFANGSIGLCFSAEEPDQLRGPQFHYCFPAGTQVQTEQGAETIESIKVGTRVWTRVGLRPVTSVGSRLSETVTIHHERGSLTGTPDHPIWVQGTGWVSMEDLRPGDRLLTWVGGIAERTDTITRDGTGGLSSDRVGSGNNTTDLYHPGIRSTIGIKIGRMTGSRISSVIPHLSMLGHTRLSRLPIVAKIVEKITERALGVGDSYRSGAYLAGTGNENRDEYRSLTSARGANECSSGDRVISSAVSPARTRRELMVDPETEPGLYSSLWFVPNASENGSPDRRPCLVDSAVLVAATRRELETVVYNLAVDGIPEFFADGVCGHNSWGDELAAWKHIPDDSGLTAWDNVQLATRLGRHPQVLATTTPKRIPMIKKLLEDATTGLVSVHYASTFDNVNLSSVYLDTILGMYAGTRLGSQELYAELMEDVEGALWTMAALNEDRTSLSSSVGRPPLRVVGVDPSVADEPTDECGIVVVGATDGADAIRRMGFVLDDQSVLGPPSVWAPRVIETARKWDAPIVAEANQGGALVREALHSIDPSVRVRLVHAKVGKALRAEPITLAYDRHRISHIGNFPELEDQMTSWVPAETAKSPDRVDALVHGLTALVLPSSYKAGTGKTTTKRPRGSIQTGARAVVGRRRAG